QTAYFKVIDGDIGFMLAIQDTLGKIVVVYNSGYLIPVHIYFCAFGFAQTIDVEGHMCPWVRRHFGTGNQFNGIIGPYMTQCEPQGSVFFMEKVPSSEAAGDMIGLVYQRAAQTRIFDVEPDTDRKRLIAFEIRKILAEIH